jgi:hypothetical protein
MFINNGIPQTEQVYAGDVDIHYPGPDAHEAGQPKKVHIKLTRNGSTTVVLEIIDGQPVNLSEFVKELEMLNHYHPPLVGCAVPPAA